MLLRIGQRPEHAFDEPLGLLSDCHRRIEHFLAVLAAITDQAMGEPLNASQRTQLDVALTYFATAAPKHTADEEDSLFPRLAARGDAAANASTWCEGSNATMNERARSTNRSIDWAADG